jgi:adenine-specific DNA methylase
MSRGALSFARSRSALLVTCFSPLRWFDILVKRATWQHGQSIHSSQRLRKNPRWNWDHRTTVLFYCSDVDCNYCKELEAVLEKVQRCEDIDPGR